jgi:hypothetical protein
MYQAYISTLPSHNNTHRNYLQIEDDLDGDCGAKTEPQYYLFARDIFLSLTYTF